MLPHDARKLVRHMGPERAEFLLAYILNFPAPSLSSRQRWPPYESHVELGGSPPRGRITRPYPALRALVDPSPFILPHDRL